MGRKIGIRSEWKNGLWRILQLGLALGLLLVATPALAAPSPQSALYTVQEGDTWVSIAFRFGVPVEEIWAGNGVTNPDLLAPGQRLFVPGANTRQDAAGSTTDLAESPSLLQIAAQADTMLVTLQTINDLQWPYVSSQQAVYIPDAILHLPPPPAYLVGAQPAPQTGVGQVPSAGEPLAPPIAGNAALPPLARSRIGAQGNFLVANQETLLDRASQMGASWVKQQVLWTLYEPAKGVYREEELTVLDSFVSGANQRGLKVLLSVVAAPDWARPSTVNHGPPRDYSDLADFMSFLGARYGSSVHAYEVWNEPNLEPEWTDFPISGSAYVDMLSVAAPAIRASAPGAIIVSAGLAPASDTPISVDDRRYLREMYAAGVANYADVIGIHPYGAGNPPDASFFGNPGTAPSHNDHPSFFFLDNINDYRIIQGEYNDGRPLWATEFGWPSADGLSLSVPEAFAYMNQVSATEQADYIFRALLMAQQWDYMGPMFIYILNFGSDRTLDDPQRAFAIVSPEGQSRPAYDMIADAPKF